MDYPIFSEPFTAFHAEPTLIRISGAISW